MPENIAELLSAHAMPSFEYIKDAPVFGWVSGRHLLERRIDEDTAFHSGHLRVALLKAERKVPGALLKAEIRQAELVRLQAEGRAFLSRHDRQEIRESILARLLPQMPPQLKAVQIAHTKGSPWLFTDALPTANADELVIHFRHAVDFAPEPVEPATAARIRRRVDVRDWMPASFTDAVREEGVDNTPGHDFLTWLWFRSETDGQVKLPNDGGKVALVIEGPLTFINTTTGGAQESVLRKGNPPASSEAKAALIAGKKLAVATINLALNDEVWKTTLVAETLVSRGLKLPDPKEDLDPSGGFQYRMLKIQEYTDILLGLYDAFVDLRMEKNKWSAEIKKMRQWVKDRQAVH